MGNLGPTVTVDEKKAYDYLIAAVRNSGKKYDGMATTGRGGLSAMQRLAYALNISNVMILPEEGLVHLAPDTLFVDDIVDTGNTLGKIPKGVDTAVLVWKGVEGTEPEYYGIRVMTDKYITFSWEW